MVAISSARGSSPIGLGLGTAILSCSLSCGQAEPPGTLQVAVAASLQGVAEELAERFAASQGTLVRLNCAGSNTLAKQIQAAGQAEVFLSADADWVSYLDQRGLVHPGSQAEFLSNKLVLIAPKDWPGKLSRLEELPELRFKHLALANPSSVPAGRYAKLALQAIEVRGVSLWEALEERIAPCLDVRAALALVAAHPGVLGLVYQSEASRSDRVQRLLELPPEQQPRIRYVAALLRARESKAPPREAAQRFLEFLSSPQAEAIYRSHGFELCPAEERAPR